MISRLYLNNCFTHQDRTFTFDEGLTGVIGPNESGKSLIVEMIRYALFGSKALRGKAADYKKLHVELDFSVNGNDYSVLRKGARCVLKRGGKELASGTRPVDEAIIMALGYGLTVFDVANACNQGNIEALSEMTPGARRAMVDQTVGLTALDAVIKFAGNEGNTLKREAAAVESSLVEPAEIGEPENYRPSEEIDVDSVAEEVAEYNKLAGFLSNAPDQPVEPDPCPVTESLEDLEAQQDKRELDLRSRKNLERSIAGIEPEEYTADELKALTKQWEDFEAFRQKQRLLAQGELSCPECGHTWPVAAEELEQFEHLGEVAEPDMTRRQLADHKSRIGNDAQIEKLRQQLATLEIPEDVSDKIRLVKDHRAAVAAYERQCRMYDRYNAELDEKRARYAELEGSTAKLARLQDELDQARGYERDLARYERDRKVYDTQKEKAEALAKRSEAFLDARDKIQALKISVKTHLLPSLNKVASILLSQMTGGERYKVEVDEDFEILIDGQSINTLSGSGKAVANLAIRIALGQILTNRVFSVFMADEVDAAMDDERAEYTACALRRLTDQVQQVILVTHKRPDTDQTFELKK